jgi:cysteine-rich repeat protein
VAAGPNIVVGVPLHDELDAINTGLAYLFSGTTYQPIRIFQNPTPDPGDQFGLAVEVAGQYVLIGAPFDDNTAGTDAGAAYLFDSVTGALARTILNPDARGSKHFGWAVAALDATNVIIGAPFDPTGEARGGVAYLFNAPTGSLRQVYYNPTPAGGDEFGSTLLAYDGDVLVGAPGHDIPADGFIPAAPDAGAVYLFDVAGALVKTIEDPVPAPGARFGQAATLLGSDLLVGAPAYNAGAVYRIDVTTGTALNTYLPPVLLGDDLFGTSITVVSGKVVVGAIRGDTQTQVDVGVVHVFDADTEALLQTITKVSPGVGDEFGRSLATTGANVIVGTPQDDTLKVDAGAVYFFPDNSCGNGVVDPVQRSREASMRSLTPPAREECDDGNFVSGDGCDANCRITACGNAIVTAPEECDDGNRSAGDGCSPICGLEGACGDGVRSPFEQCDDGNRVNGDGCDGNCTFTACGNGVTAAAEQCDDGPANGTDLCCSATCQRIDSDGDGVCDRSDVCPNTADPLQENSDGDLFGDACDICPTDVDNDIDGDLFCTGSTFNPPALGGKDPCSRLDDAGTWSKPKALFSRLGPPSRDDRMRLKGRFNVGALLPAIAPHTHGVHIRVIDAGGGLIIDERIPGGPAWKMSGSANNQWKYTDPMKPAGHNGISQIVIRNLLFQDPTLFSIAVHGDKGTYGIQPDREMIRVTVELNDNAIPPGRTPGRDQCGEVQFSKKVGKPTCTFSGAVKLLCK